MAFRIRLAFWKKRNGVMVAPADPVRPIRQCRTTIENATEMALRVILIDIQSNKMVQSPPFVGIAGRTCQRVKLQRTNCSGAIRVEVTAGAGQASRWGWIATPRVDGGGVGGYPPRSKLERQTSVDPI